MKAFTIILVILTFALISNAQPHFGSRQILKSAKSFIIPDSIITYFFKNNDDSSLVQKNINFLDNNGRDTLNISSTLDTVSQSWQYFVKITTNYDVKGNPLDEIYYTWDSGNWIIDTKYKYDNDYDNNGVLFRYTQELWNNLSLKWGKNEKDSLIYDNDGKKIGEIIFRWINDSWDSTGYHAIAYYPDGSIASETYPNDSKFLYFYSPSGSFTQCIWYDWKINDWILFAKSYGYYKNRPTFIKTNAIDSKTSAYPSPSDGKFRINSNSCIGQMLEIYNIQGSLVKTQKIEESGAEYDLSQFGKGVYLIKIGDNRFKIMIQ